MKRNQTLKSNFFTIMVIALFTLLTGVIQSAEGQNYKLTAIPLKEVRVTDQFWAPRIETNRTVTMPVAFQKYEQRGHMCSPKMIEGASYSLQNHPDRELENYIGRLIDKVAALQEDDGYLHRKRDQARWSHLSHSHELYNLGHMYEAAVAHYLATSKRTLLDVATRNADLLCRVFGPDKKRDIPGHPEIELALVKLYCITGNEKYLKLAKFLLDERGHYHGRKLYSHKGIVNYAQDHKPVIEQSEAVGHAVRAVYMYSGLTDVAALTGDSGYLKALDRIWENCVTKKLYINGGIGVRWEGEAFGDNYELPNKTAHSETCAAIANVFWNHRMNLLHGEAKYIDVLELALYNRVLAGVSLDGSSTFYKGPLASNGTVIRDATMRTPIKDNIHCCVTNIVRIIPQIGRYTFTADDDGIYVNLYIGSTGKITVKDKPVILTQETRYPWQGTVKITVEPAEPIGFDLNLRIPGWCVGSSPVWGDLYRFAEKSRQTVVIKINGKVEKSLDMKKGYARLRRRWKSGDVVELSLPMPIRRVHCHPNVKNNIGRAAIMRGPIVYCAEGLDNDGHALNLLLTDDKKLRTEYRKDLLGGVTVIRGKVSVLYPGEGGKLMVKKNQEFTAIPYYAWANRGLTEMAIWLARDQSVLTPVAPPTIASTSRVTTSHFGDKMRLHAYTLNNQLEPKSSNDRSAPQFNWWPIVGSHEWAQYDFKKPEKVSAVEVYWFDEQPGGGCGVPKSWQLLYKDGLQWKPVKGASEYATKRDQYNKVTFDPVETTALRIKLEMQPNFSAGILEWRVEPPQVNPPPYTDYCAMLSQEIQGKKHGFLAGNLVYYVGGQYAVWNKQEDETLGLTHPFFHDLRSRGYGMVEDEASGYGSDMTGWEFYRKTRIAYGTVIIGETIIGETQYPYPVPTKMYWRPDKMICEYSVGGVNIQEEKFISQNDVACTIITSSEPVTIKFDGHSFVHPDHSVERTSTIEYDDANNAIHIVEGGTIMVKPTYPSTPREGVLMYDGMSTVISASKEFSSSYSAYRDGEGQQVYSFEVPCDSDGVAIVWAMDDEYSNALNRAQQVLADPAGKLAAKTQFMNDLLNYQIPYFRCSDDEIVDVYYFLWSIYLMYYIDVGEGWEQYPHTQTAVNNFLGLHRYDSNFQIRVGSWTVDQDYYAYGNVLLWSALLPRANLSKGLIPADNMGKAWLCSDCPGAVGGHVPGAWQIYQHTGDLGFLQDAYDFYKSLMWQRVPGPWGAGFNAAECLAKMANELGYSSDPNHWYDLVGMDKIDSWLNNGWETDTPHFFGSGARKMDWSNMAYMGMNQFPEDWAREMTAYWAVNDQVGYFGQVPLLTKALKDLDQISNVFTVTPDTNWWAIRGMYLHHVGNNANLCALGHLKGYNIEWGIPVAPESRDINFDPWGDQYSNFNAGKILLILEGIAGLSYSVVDDTFTVCGHLPKEWDYMEVRVPIKESGQTRWTKVSTTRQTDANDVVEKTVTVEGNSQSTLYVQPWLEGLDLKSVSDPNYDTNQPRGHISYTFADKPNVTVVLQLHDESPPSPEPTEKWRKE